jgi:hypothetical protein
MMRTLHQKCKVCKIELGEERLPISLPWEPASQFLLLALSEPGAGSGLVKPTASKISSLLGKIGEAMPKDAMDFDRVSQTRHDKDLFHLLIIIRSWLGCNLLFHPGSGYQTKSLCVRLCWKVLDIFLSASNCKTILRNLVQKPSACLLHAYGKYRCLKLCKIRATG